MSESSDAPPPPSGDPGGFDFGALARIISGTDQGPGEDPPPGLRQFGEFILEREIARGGMGVVYEATQLTLGRKVAVKMLRDSVVAGSQDVTRFRREAAAVAALRHRNIVGIHSIAEHEGTHFFSMDYVPGQTLAQMLIHGPLPPRQAAALMVKVALAIHHAHTHGVLHRDLKPSNILMDGEGEPMVTDFGLAMNAAEDAGLTLTGQVLGTPAYMAPEQAAGKSGTATAATDVYGLGALMYHLLAGRPPFSGESHLAILQQVMNAEPPSISVVSAAVSQDLDTVCARAMAKEPHRRYPSALAFAEDVQRYLDGREVLARPISGMAKLWRWARRHPALAASLTGIVLLLAAVAVVSTLAAQRLSISGREASEARDLARENAARSKLNLYASDMRIAMESWERGALGVMQARLADHIPAPGEPDQRDFEWYMMDAMQHGQQTALTALPGRPSSAAFTPDGSLVLFSIGAQTHLWNAVSKMPLLQWDEPLPDKDEFYRKVIRVTPDVLVSAWQTGLRMVDLKSRQVRVMEAAPCESMALSPDGTQLAVASRFPGNAGTPWVRIFQTVDWKVAREIPRECRDLDWTEQGQLVVLSVPSDGPRDVGGVLEWFDPARPEPVREQVIRFPSLVRHGLLHAKSDRAYLMLENLNDHLIRLSDGTNLNGRASNALCHAGMDAAFRQMAVAGQDQRLQLFDLEAWTGTINNRKGHTDRVLGMVCMGGDHEFRTIARDGTIREWDFRSGPHDFVFGITHADSRTAVLPLSPGTGRFIGMIEQWCGQNGTDRTHIFDRDRNENIGITVPCSVLGISGDGQTALGLDKGTIVRADLSSREQTVINPVLDLPAQPVAWLPRISRDWRCLAWTPDDRELILTEISTGREIGKYALIAGVPVFSPDGTRMAIPQRTIVLVDVASGVATDTGIACGSMLAWSADGKRIASLLNNGIQIFDLSEKRLTHHLTGHRTVVSSMAWSPDGRSIAVGCDDSTLTFWNLATSRPASELRLTGVPFLLGFADDSSAVVVGTMGGYRIFQANLPGTEEASRKGAETQR